MIAIMISDSYLAKFIVCMQIMDFITPYLYLSDAIPK